ncbi:Uncharacterized protein involved in methicillin resistance [Edwardsiella tarda]|uniref:Uncharacterized protein n=2 Tax=Edwardsiella tarda TaxID=636 RepID=A0AC61TF82_EDWTA|nr:hypothetical protein [Edwardsiella tarda]UAL57766.1 hypothetical protein K8O98_07680 [Edwardsiella tarda]UCP99174.1 hypothetical protein DCL27_10835 [Edwardsiella tarda ATCC 15947 = NBRC 105688]UCQ53248.1 hypothetical protein DCF75_10840 [Edwardsiella tarda]STD29945.1 Uncharacterized protein involved in methicillin resistance [Edwardsiella tarda]
MFVINERFKIKSVWFSESPISSKYPLLIYKNVFESDLLNFKKTKSINAFKYGYTLLTDLTMDIDGIKSTFKKNVRYEINKTIQISPEIVERNYITDDELTLLNELYLSIGLRKVTPNRISKYNPNNLKVTSISYCGKLVCFHVYLYDSKRARLLYSACIKGKVECDGANIDSSFFNRYLHFKDIQLFKNYGLQSYDWGGVSSIENPNGVDRFKFGFSGSVIKSYTIYSPLLSLAKILKLL